MTAGRQPARAHGGRNRWWLVPATGATLLAAGCAGGGSAAGPPNPSPSPAASSAPGAAATSPPATTPVATRSATAPPSRRTTAPSGRARPLAGQVIGIDPGHNGRNKDDPGYINRLIWNGREQETCNTTGTETDAGYTEAQFNFNVATYLRADLRRDGARVVMTRYSNNGVGPCVNRRAAIINAAHPSVAIDIHADGGPSSGRGFTVLEPVADGPNDKIIGAAVRFGADVRTALLRYTQMPTSTYDGRDGVVFRDNLAGLNLIRVPLVLVECGNMRNSVDAALLTAPSFQRRLARAFTAAMIAFLHGH